MADIKKVIIGIEHCDRLGCSMCPYKPGGYTPMDCRIQLMRDALALLKEQEPLAVCEDKINKCVCGNEINRCWNPEYCGFCGKKLLWY